MRKRQVIKVCLVLCCIMGMASGETYYWDGDSSTTDDWVDGGNWNCVGSCFCHMGNCGYPDDTGDDAGFRNDPGPVSVWEVDFDDETITIDDLNISYSVNFNGPTPFGEVAELHLDTIIIGGPGNVIVRAVGAMKIKAP